MKKIVSPVGATSTTVVLPLFLFCEIADNHKRSAIRPFTETLGGKS